MPEIPEQKNSTTAGAAPGEITEMPPQDVDFRQPCPGESDEEDEQCAYARCPACNDAHDIYGGDWDGSTPCPQCGQKFAQFQAAYKREYRPNVPSRKAPYETVEQLRDAGAIGAMKWYWDALMSMQKWTPHAAAIDELLSRLFAAHLREVCLCRSTNVLHIAAKRRK